MEIVNSSSAQFRPSVVMMVYGEGGVGKSSFAATAPSPIFADCEGGTKYFGLRGIGLDIGRIEKWQDVKDFIAVAQNKKYETVIIDPIGELMDKLKRFMIAQNDRKLVQSDGSPTMAGWGWLKSTMRAFLKALRDAGKHVIIVAHVAEGKDEERIIKRPLLETKLSEEIVNMVDIVGYMTIVRGAEGDDKRVIIVDPSSDKYVAKDRTGQLGKYIEPDFAKIIQACQGTATFAWSNPLATKVATPVPEKNIPPVTPEQKNEAEIADTIADEEKPVDNLVDNTEAEPNGIDPDGTGMHSPALQNVRAKLKTAAKK